MVVGVDDLGFSVTEAVIDYSTDSNAVVMRSSVQNSINYGSNSALKATHLSSSWRGFFMKELTMTLPGAFKAKGNSKIDIAIQNLICDGSTGITGKGIAVFNNFKTEGIEGWAVSLDTVSLELVGSSISGDGLKVRGGVNIPIMEGEMKYLALFNAQAISFNLEVAGDYNVPFLKGSQMKLYEGSFAGISYKNNKFVPSANLNGEFSISIDKVTLPPLEFHNSNNITTGGLDKLSFGTFKLGGVAFSGVSQSPASANTSKVSVNNTNPISSDQKLMGFPFYLKDIKFENEKIKEESFYVFKFIAGLNLIEGQDAFKVEGGFSILGKLDFQKIMTEEPWTAISYHDTKVNSFSIDATLGIIKINGCIEEYNDSNNEGFRGGLEMTINLHPKAITVSSSGNFGINKSENFRYFYVDAEVVGFEIPLGLISIYGFSGGLYYNMIPNFNGQDKADGMEINSIQNYRPSSPCGNFKQGSYMVNKGTFGFKVGTVLGLPGSPEAFSADVEFGITFNTQNNNNFGVQTIYFDGSANIMSESLRKRKEASIRICLKLIYDTGNNTLSGNLGGNINLMAGVFTGGYNRNCNETNISFNFENGNYFFFIGRPELGQRAEFNLTISILNASAEAYLFLTNDKTQTFTIPTIQKIFESKGIILDVSNIGNPPGSAAGIAFGINTTIKSNFSFLFFEADLTATLGFDLSMTQDKEKPCTLDSWRLYGQAYGGFQGVVNINVDLGFYKGKIEAAKLSLAAGLTASFPENPIFLEGFLAGEYSVFDGLVKGGFKLPFELGEECSPNNSGTEQLSVAKIPLIKEIWPANGQVIEIYQNPSVSLLLPIDQPKYFHVWDEKTNKTEEVVITPKIELMQVGNQICSPKLQNDNYVAVSKRSFWLEPNSTYSFRLKIKWETTSNKITGPLILDTTVTFRTAGFPNEIVYEMFEASMPVKDQKYWHKGYAEALMEFDQGGACSFFPKDTAVSVITNSAEIAQAFCLEKWNIEPFNTPRPSNNPISVYKGPSAVVSSLRMATSSNSGSLTAPQHNGNSGTTLVNYQNSIPDGRSGSSGGSPAIGSIVNEPGRLTGRSDNYFYSGGSTTGSFTVESLRGGNMVDQGTGYSNQSQWGGNGSGFGNPPPIGANVVTGRPPITDPNPGPGGYGVPPPVIPSNPPIETIITICSRRIDPAADSYKISKRVEFLYFIRLTDVLTRQIQLLPAKVPGMCDRREVPKIIEKDLGGNFKVPWISVDISASEKQIKFEGLNALDLNKGHVYKIELIRILDIDSSLFEIVNGQVRATSDKAVVDFGDSTNMVINGYKLSVASQESNIQLLKSLTQEKILYQGHYFGVSKFENFSEKVINSFGNPSVPGNSTQEWKLPGNNPIPNIKPWRAFSDKCYIVGNAIEYFDEFDLIKFLENTKRSRNNSNLSKFYADASPYYYNYQKKLIPDHLFISWYIPPGKSWTSGYYEDWGYIFNRGGFARFSFETTLTNEEKQQNEQFGKTQWGSFINHILNINHFINSGFQFQFFSNNIISDMSFFRLNNSEKTRGVVDSPGSREMGNLLNLAHLQLVDYGPRYAFNNLQVFYQQTSWIKLKRDLFNTSGYYFYRLTNSRENDAAINTIINNHLNQYYTELDITNRMNFYNNQEKLEYTAQNPNVIPKYIHSAHTGPKILLNLKNAN
jgi:hypothetical protein